MALRARFGTLPSAVGGALEAACRHDLSEFLSCFTRDASVDVWGCSHTTSASIEYWARDLLSDDQFGLTDFIYAQLGEIAAVHAQMTSRDYIGPVTFAFTLNGARIRALHITT
ncbi:hypothetical protein [Microbacterium sp. P02]|uniref:hypothetical protein n=1 Tax=Microbacterium sp. P02 TaxID=3366260 RepID=UPI00366DDC62